MESLEEVAARLYEGGILRRQWRLTGGVSASVEALEIALPDGSLRRVVLRRHEAVPWKQVPPDLVATEYALQAALHGAGLPVPEPLFLDLSRALLPSPFLVMAWVEGTTDVAPAALAGALEQMADFLARLHALDPTSLALPALPPGDDPVTGALHFLPDTESLRDLRERIAERFFAQPRAVLLHGDYWPGNVLWKEGRLAAVLDWEGAALGDPLSDLACCRVELACRYGEEAAETFTRLYLAASRVDARALPVWDVYVSAAALASMADRGLPAEVEALRRERTTRFLEEAGGRV